MFRSSTSLIALILFAAPALAADIDADSLVSAATVYPQGAQVTRVVKFSAGPGENRIIIDDLPLDFDPASLRVSGTGDAAFSIISVDHRVDRLLPVADAVDPVKQRIEGEIKALEGQIQSIENENQLLDADIEAAKTRQKFAEQLMKREPQNMVDDVERQRAGPETWVQIIGLLSDETGKALRAIALTEQKIDANNTRIDALNEDLSKKQDELYATTLPAPDRSIATVEMVADTAVEGTLEVTYQVWNAGWAPVYDLRLDQGDDAKLVLARHARVSQQTGEDWNDVALTLSTARPSGRLDTPELASIQASFYTPVEFDGVVGGAMTSATPAPTAEPQMMNEEQAKMLADDSDLRRERVDAEMVSAVAALQGQTVVYQLAATADVSGDGTVRQVSIDQRTINASLLARATPEFDTNAYLYATIVNTFSGPLLPGQASVFRDGTFVGQSMLPLIAEGKEVVLPFGVIDGLSVERHVLEKTDSDFGIIGTTNQRAERFEITVESVLTYALPVTIYDRVPFTESEDLQVLPYANPEPSVKDVNGKRGVQNWTFMLEAGAKKTIEFGYEIRWPGDTQMIVQ